MTPVRMRADLRLGAPATGTETGGGPTSTLSGSGPASDAFGSGLGTVGSVISASVLRVASG